MCWNKQVSFLTLLIGTVFTILLWTSTSDPNVRVIALIWQFVLCMQLFEGLSWISKEIQSSELSHFSTKCAFIFNVLQPIVAALLCMTLTDSSVMKYSLIALTMVYMVFLLYSASSTSFSDSLFGNSDTCHHLQLYWWGNFSSWVFIFYIILVTLACLSIKPLRLGIVQITYIVCTLILSNWLYPCTYGSIWCWFAAFAPLLTYFYIKAYPL
jgi:hypothetical protein